MSWLVAAEVLPEPQALILIGAAAFVLPLLARKMLLPAIVLEIVFGAVVGPDVLHLIEAADRETIALLAELGLLLLMFLAGFEVDFERIEKHGPRQLITGASIVGLIMVSSWFGAGLLNTEGVNQQIFVALLITAASVGIVVPALRATRRGGTKLGQLIIITTVIAEFTSLIGIVFLGVWVEDGFSVGLLSIPLMFALMAVTLLTVRRAAWWHPEWFARLFSSDDPDELGIRASLALMLVFVGVSIALGIEAILGAFLAGTLLAFIFRQTHTLETRLSGFVFGFFVPIFFINVGIRFPVRRLAEPEVLGSAAALIGVALAVKILPAMVLTFQRFRLREALAAGVLLAGQLSVIIALAELGTDLDLLTADLAAAAILLVAVTVVLSPVAFRILAPPLPEPASAPAPNPNRT